jgi:His-Xaa-Ser system radical SAM maturase HxsB
MNFLPLRTRFLRGGRQLHVNDDGRFFGSDAAFVERCLEDQLNGSDLNFLSSRGHTIDIDDELGMLAHSYRVSRRLTRSGELDYLILVPTLRCNLSCSYCQVSRAPEKGNGFDWSRSTTEKVLELIAGITASRIKIEFQGGEPTLRPDLIQAVIERCERFEDCQFVICTNLHEIGPDQWQLFDRDDVYISTSLDGDLLTHSKQRTGEETGRFEANLRAVIDRYGPGKVSALPTIDPLHAPDPDGIIDTFMSFGLTSIFLRPINFQGFARKRHRHSRELSSEWNDYHANFVRKIIERNWNDRSTVLEETYFGICLRRIFYPDTERHVDLRNPNPMGVDYLVVDFDGHLYPTDEARMLSRSGVIDLSLGMIGDDWRGEKWAELNIHTTNEFDPACSRCAYQPFCGRDIVDDLARYGKIDVERTETVFCQRHLALFDFLFELLFDDSPAVQYSLARWLRLDTETACLAEIRQ